MQQVRRKSITRPSLEANSLRSDDRHNFPRMFGPGVPEAFDKVKLTAVDDPKHANTEERIARVHASNQDKQFLGAVTMPGEYADHQDKECRDGGPRKARNTKADMFPVDHDPAHLPHSPKQNRLLAALDGSDYVRVLPDLEFVELPLGCVVCEAGCHMDHVYFPTTAIVSNFYELESGASAEISVTGNDGLVGIALMMGGETTTSRAVVRNAGYAYRLDAEVLKREFETGRMLRSVLLRYTQALITQMAQIAVCNCHHNVEQQLCRLLLFSLDRLPTNEMALTQELIASLLGVRRESVTEVAGKLQAGGLIRYNRGRITVLDRREMEARVCECYEVVKSEFERLVPPQDSNLTGPDHRFASAFEFTGNSCVEPLRRQHLNGDRRARRVA